MDRFRLSSPRCGGYSGKDGTLSSPHCGGYSEDQEWHFDPKVFLPRVAGVTLANCFVVTCSNLLSSPRSGGYSTLRSHKITVD